MKTAPPISPVLHDWQQLEQALQRLQAGDLPVHAFTDQARASSALRAALPARFDTVLQHLLDRLEAGALFTEESCSFSQRDLADNLQLWLDKARNQLTGA